MSVCDTLNLALVSDETGTSLISLVRNSHADKCTLLLKIHVSHKKHSSFSCVRSALLDGRVLETAVSGLTAVAGRSSCVLCNAGRLIYNFSLKQLWSHSYELQECVWRILLCAFSFVLASPNLKAESWFADTICFAEWMKKQTENRWKNGSPGGAGAFRSIKLHSFQRRPASQNCVQGHMKGCCRHINTDESFVHTWKEIFIDRWLEYPAFT